ncbi:class I SAM-dependent methyltransferase [Endozoicomonas elysicola]|uniref:Methyltransferase domain-containing protein n=1 Tax=Endozoicomonas elysicola TaxID=305900 RepID=A0A081K5L1_9GAMM|nr:class I SAM-dependent methyltransferase [Endozoicomonas elysicola]KEI69437.1 hypothetical protein GV64_00640 [Endozoicomonas elysicola]
MEKHRSTIGYDAQEFSKTELLPLRLWVERWNIYQAVISSNVQLNGSMVGDFGSGTGYYTRMLIDMGAARVIAIDTDPGMIGTARKESLLYNPLIKYENAPVENTSGRANCQLVLGTYLMNYPKTAEEAVLYCQAIASHLSPSGVFIGYMNNPFERAGGRQYKQYGFWKEYGADLEGDYSGCWVDVHIDGMSSPIRNYHLFPEVYEWAFREAGMSMQWREVELHPGQKGNSYWDCFFEGMAPYKLIIAA